MAGVSSLGLAVLLAACGDREPAKSANGSSDSSSSSVSLPATIDVNNPTEVAAVLKTFDVEAPVWEEISRDRGTGPTGEVYPTWPAGDVRLKGISTFRVDATDKYDNGGTLKFMKGGKTLFETPFSPDTARSVTQVPAAVLSSLKVGDVVSWGIYFSSKSKKPATASFNVVAEKAQVTKALGKIDQRNATNQILRDLATAQVFQNYGLHSEALELYVKLYDADNTLDYVWNPVLTSLRALKQKDSPLFQHAKIHALATTGSRRIATEGHSTPTPTMNRPVATPSNAGGSKTGSPSAGPAGTAPSSGEPTAIGPTPGAGGPQNGPDAPGNGGSGPSNGLDAPGNGGPVVGQGSGSPSGPPPAPPALSSPPVSPPAGGPDNAVPHSPGDAPIVPGTPPAPLGPTPPGVPQGGPGNGVPHNPGDAPIVPGTPPAPPGPTPPGVPQGGPGNQVPHNPGDAPIVPGTPPAPPGPGMNP